MNSQKIIQNPKEVTIIQKKSGLRIEEYGVQIEGDMLIQN